MEKLNATERSIAALVAEGAGNKEIAGALHMAEQTVKWHLMTTYRILDIDPSKNQRVLLAVAVERERDEREGC